jgi:hypothetical protein
MMMIKLRVLNITLKNKTMRKICVLILIFSGALRLYANPIAMPSVEISELYFDEYGKWKLELYYRFYDKSPAIDSIYISSMTDLIKLPRYKFKEKSGLLVITPDSLDREFNINRFADTIKVTTYAMGPIDDILIFGKLAGASIGYPRKGQSISKYYSFVKDKSPTIGYANDTTGMCGTVKGVVYNENDEPVKNRTLGLDNFFNTSENGEYSTRVFARPSSYWRVKYKTILKSTSSALVNRVNYVMEPDSIIELDIYLAEELSTEVNNQDIEDSAISVYPNPVKINQELYVDIDLPIITSDIWIEIVDLRGAIIAKRRVKEHHSSLTAPADGGFYIVKIILSSNIISLNKIVVNE